MTDRREPANRNPETYKSPDAPDVDVQQGRPDPIEGDASPESRARVGGTRLEGPNPAGGGGFTGISMGVLWTVVILLVVAAAVILFFAL